MLCLGQIQGWALDAGSLYAQAQNKVGGVQPVKSKHGPTVPPQVARMHLVRFKAGPVLLVHHNPTPDNGKDGCAQPVDTVLHTSADLDLSTVGSRTSPPGLRRFFEC
eukprot:1161287-Pelagomonas_calceolata.AAC.7